MLLAKINHLSWKTLLILSWPLLWEILFVLVLVYVCKNQKHPISTTYLLSFFQVLDTVSYYVPHVGFLEFCLNRWGMGPLLVLVSRCFRENVVVTYKIGSFLCRLDNLLHKNVIVSFFGNQISKWLLFEKRAIFDLLFTFFSYQGKVTKFLPHISHSHTYMYFAHPVDFFALPILKKIRIYQVWFLFGVIPSVGSYSHHFWTINK